MNELIARRQFTPTYMVLDVLFLILMVGLLCYKKKYMTLLVGLVMGLVYFAVDYGIFYLALGARQISEGYSMFKVLLWMSLSYGFTNFCWIWLGMSRDEYFREWSLLILLWWFGAPMMADQIGSSVPPIVIQRTTSSYHGFMAAMLFIGYLLLIIYNMREEDPSRRIPIFRLLFIGIMVQFGWEACLLLGGIRSAGFSSLALKLRPLIVNSLLETNLGMPYSYLLFIAYSRRYTEQLKKRPEVLSFSDRILENNQE